MTVDVRVHHETIYRYSKPVYLGPHHIRLKPAYHSRVAIDDYRMNVQPEPFAMHWQQDPFANPLVRAVFDGAVDQLTISVDFVASLVPINPFNFFIEPSATHWPFQYDPSLRQLTPFFETVPASSTFEQWLSSLPQRSDYIVDYLVQLNQLVFERIAYRERHEEGVQSPEETLSIGIGSCRDSAWLLVQTLRHLGLMSRFVSGYLIQPETAATPSSEINESRQNGQHQTAPSGTPDEAATAREEQSLSFAKTHSEATIADRYTVSLHAWTEVYLPGAGWIGMDPTSGLMAGEGHIPLACTPNWPAAAPVEGTHEQSEVTLSHHASVDVV